MEEELNYYSVSFEYNHAIRGHSAYNSDGKLALHISYAVDERRESDRLSKALNIVCDTLDRFNLDHRNEYCWPDGSLLRYIRTQYDLINLTMVLQGAFRNWKLEIVPLNPTEKRRPWEDDSEDLYQHFANVRSEKCYKKQKLIKFVSKAILAVAS